MKKTRLSSTKYQVKETMHQVKETIKEAVGNLSMSPILRTKGIFKKMIGITTLLNCNIRFKFYSFRAP